MVLRQTNDNKFGCAKWIVDTLAASGTHTTITSAIASASAGDTIFIKPGIYTENFTVTPGIDLASYECDGNTPNVTIVGTITVSGAGTVSISGIQLKTNAAPFLTISGSAASIVYLDNCYLNCSNNTGITCSSSGSPSLFVTNCKGTFGSVTTNLFTITAAGTYFFSKNLLFFGTGVTTASNISAGTLFMQYNELNFPLSTSGTGGIAMRYTDIQCQNQNVTCLTTAGAATNSIEFSNFASGSASALSFGTGTTTTLTKSTVASTNTNAITGAGTINYTDISFEGTSNVINTTTQSANFTNLGKYKATGQPGFLIFATGVTNVTGDGTTATIIFNNTVYDTATNFNTTTGVFTAPVAGKYLLQSHALLNGMSALFTAQAIAITTTAVTFTDAPNVVSAGTQRGIQVSCIANMAVGDTASVNINVSGSTKTIGTANGSATDLRTWFTGQLIA